MINNNKDKILKEFMTIPSVGKSVAEDLWELGYRSIEQLKNEDPEKMYEEHCHQKGCKVDRCVLYTFRCLVYYVSNDSYDPELLKWWNWKNYEL